MMHWEATVRRLSSCSIPTLLMLIAFQRTLPNIQGTVSPGWKDYKKVLFDKDLLLINLGTLMALYGFWVLILMGSLFSQG